MSNYEIDVYRWSERQGALLRRLAARERVNAADLDWPNIAEEIETVGRSELAALSSHISNASHQVADLADYRPSRGLTGDHLARAQRG